MKCTVCHTNKIPKNTNIPDLDLCEECMIDLCQQNLDNFGRPETGWCGHCGNKFQYDDLVYHLNANSKGQCSNAQSRET